jgi:hypothetical protein
MLNYFRFFVFIIITVLFYFGATFYYNTINKDIKEGAIKEEVNHSTTIDKEFNQINKRVEFFDTEIRKIIEENKDKITRNNCKGLLYDQNNDDIYEKKIFGTEFKYNSNVIIKYNFCAYTWNDQHKISFMYTTKKLINEFEERSDQNEKLVPAITFVSAFIDKELRRESEKGLLKVKDIMSY